MQKKNFFGLNMFSMLAMSDVFNNLKSFSCSVSNKFLKRIAKLLIEDEMHPSKVVFRCLEKIRKLSKLSENWSKSSISKILGNINSRTAFQLFETLYWDTKMNKQNDKYYTHTHLDPRHKLLALNQLPDNI